MQKEGSPEVRADVDFVPDVEFRVAGVLRPAGPSLISTKRWVGHCPIRHSLALYQTAITVLLSMLLCRIVKKKTKFVDQVGKFISWRNSPLLLWSPHSRECGRLDWSYRFGFAFKWNHKFINYIIRYLFHYPNSSCYFEWISFIVSSYWRSHSK